MPTIKFFHGFAASCNVLYTAFNGVENLTDVLTNFNMLSSGELWILIYGQMYDGARRTLGYPPSSYLMKPSTVFTTMSSNGASS